MALFAAVRSLRIGASVQAGSSREPRERERKDRVSNESARRADETLYVVDHPTDERGQLFATDMTFRQESRNGYCPRPIHLWQISA